MIRNDTEYQQAVRRSQEERARLGDHETRLRESGLSPDEVRRALEPLQSFHLQLTDEIEAYDRLKRGELPELSNLHGLGVALVSYRIASGLTQRELAERLGVHESQVSRDERNEYHGMTVERASRVLDALKADLKATFQRVGQAAGPTGSFPAPEFVSQAREPNAAASLARGPVWVSGSGTTITTGRSLTTRRAA
jgi:transcriptional regulator with XRE-family HTH domain